MTPLFATVLLVSVCVLVELVYMAYKELKQHGDEQNGY